MGTEGLSYTLAPRVKNLREPENVAIKEAIPGPGHYEPLNMGTQGKYPISNVRNTKAAVWSPTTTTRFPIDFKHSYAQPHHSTYNPSDIESTDPCKYILSRHKTMNAKKIVPLKLQKQNTMALPAAAYVNRT